jgi:hypothetical protein
MIAFNLGTNFCQSFILGEPSNSSDFFLRGQLSGNALQLEGRIFDDSGKLLLEFIGQNSFIKEFPLQQGENISVSDESTDFLKLCIDEPDLSRFVPMQIEFMKSKNIIPNLIVNIHGKFFSNTGKLLAEGSSSGLKTYGVSASIG